MALTEDLNIYRSMYNLLRLIIQSRNAFDKSFKYVVGDRMVDTALNCVTLIHYANEDRRKGAREEHLDKFLIEFDILKTLIMVCRDERQYKKDSVLADVFLLTADVESQAEVVARLSGMSATLGPALPVDRIDGASYLKAVSGLRPRSLSMPVHRAVSLLPR